jgi:hypothetical protein
MTRHLSFKKVNYAFVVYDKDLIGVLKRECPRIKEMTEARVECLSPYSKELKTDVNYFEPNLRSYRIK